MTKIRVRSSRIRRSSKEGCPRGGLPSLLLVAMVAFMAGCAVTFHLHTTTLHRSDHFSRNSEGLPDTPLIDTPTVSTTKANTPEHQPTKTLINPKIQDALLQIYEISAEKVWGNLLEEGAALRSSSSQKNLVAIEVGMQKAWQCIWAAEKGFSTHCVEPSPNSFQRIEAAVRKTDPETQNRIHLHQKAAGATSGMMLDFSGSGGTGDHVGEFDVWNMKVGKTKDKEILAKVGAKTVQVASVKMDDIVQEALRNDDERVFVLKVDTQGYEPSVFAGLNDSVFQRRRVDYVLFEYWPKGMDLMASSGEDGSDVTKACLAAGLLEKLQKAGYTLYALPNTAHPAAPAEAKGALRGERAPLQSPRDNCAFYYELEKRFPSPNYKMGYWSDILAVAPNAALAAAPVTAVGQALKQQQLNVA